MENKYYILGSGGLAKEIYFLAEETLSEGNKFMGFIDLDPTSRIINVRGNKENVIKEDYFLKNIKPNFDIHIYMGVGDPHLIEKLSLKFSNFVFPNLIHPNFIGDRNSIKMGTGNLITAGCVFTVDIEIGNNNIFNLNTTIGHDSVIDDFNVFNPGVNISGGVKIKSGNLFGTNCAVLQKLQVGNNNTIGACSLVIRNIGDDNILVGVPAKSFLK